MTLGSSAAQAVPTETRVQTWVREQVGWAASDHSEGPGMWDAAAQRLGFESFEHAGTRSDPVAIELLAHRAKWESKEGPDLATSVGQIDQRLQVSWPTSYSASAILAHLRREMREIDDAVSEAVDRPHMRKHVVEECGDAMLLLARLALMHGATSALEPLVLAVRKTERRLGHFEKLVRSMTPADAWRAAKVRARQG